MTVKEALAKLKSLGDEKVRKQNLKWHVTGDQFGVKHGDIRKLAQKIKTNHELAMGLWDTGNLDAQLLAILLMDVKSISAKEMDRLVQSTGGGHVADWLSSYILKHHPDKEALRARWLASRNRWALRAGWALTAGRAARSPEGLDIPALLDRLESEMADSPPEVQWTMNTCLAEIGINHAKLRKRALDIGERLGIYRDWPVSKGCTSPFAPIWINEMVRRQTSVKS